MKLSDFKLILRDKQSESFGEEAEKIPTVKNPEKPQAAAKTKIAPKRREGRLPVLPEPGSELPDALTLVRICLAVALVVASALIKTLPDWALLPMRIVAAVGVGYDIVWNTITDIRNKVYSGDGLPVVLAAALAFVNGMSLEAAIAVTILQIALCLRSYAYCRTAAELRAAISLPGFASKLSVGDSFMLEKGKAAPADCKVLSGAVTVDLSYICGRRAEMPMKPGDIIPAGCTVLGGSALAEVVRPATEAVTSGIANAIGGGFEELTRTERTINRAANFLAPAFLGAGFVLLILTSLISDMAFRESLRRVIAIIAIGTPCGVLATLPLVYLAAMVGQRKRGAAFLSAKALDDISYAKAVVFEKAGTVTSDTYSVSNISLDKMDPKTFLKVAAHAVSGSKNPIARVIISAYGGTITPGLVRNYFEYPDWGVSVTVDNISILLGTSEFMSRNLIEVPRGTGADCSIFMTVNGIMAGWISLDYTIDEAIKTTIANLSKSGVDRIVMMSGDGRESDSATAQEVGIAEYYAECSEDDKARNITELRSRVDSKGSIVYICGAGGSAKAAGIADVAVVVYTFDTQSLGGAADVLLLGQSATKLPEAMLAGKRAKRAAIAYALSGLGIKLVLAALAGTGIAPLWFVVMMDALVSLALICLTFSLFRSGKRPSFDSLLR